MRNIGLPSCCPAYAHQARLMTCMTGERQKLCHRHKAAPEPIIRDGHALARSAVEDRLCRTVSAHATTCHLRTAVSPLKEGMEPAWSWQESCTTHSESTPLL